MSHQSDILFDEWERNRGIITQTMFRDPHNIINQLWSKDGLWSSESDCPVINGIHNAHADTQCARISCLTSHYEIGSPHRKVIDKGFVVESGKHKGRCFKLYRYSSSGITWDVKNLGPTWYLNTDPITRKIIVQLIINNLLNNTGIDFIVPEIITSYQCGSDRCVLSEYYQSQIYTWKHSIDSRERLFVNKQLEHLYKILSIYQWFDSNLEQNLYIVPLGTDSINLTVNGTEYNGSYQLCYIPDNNVEIKIHLSGGEDLFIAPRSRSSLTDRKIDYQRRNLLETQ